MSDRTYTFNEHGVCTDPHEADFSGRGYSVTVSTAFDGSQWGFGYSVDSRQGGYSGGACKRRCCYPTQAEAERAALKWISQQTPELAAHLGKYIANQQLSLF